MPGREDDDLAILHFPIWNKVKLAIFILLLCKLDNYYTNFLS